MPVMVLKELRYKFCLCNIVEKITVSIKRERETVRKLGNFHLVILTLLLQDLR